MKSIFLLIAFGLVGLSGLVWAKNQPQLSTTEAVEAPDPLFERDTYRIDTIVCPFRGEIEYEPGEIECGLLQVPENREKPDSRMIELHFIKLNSKWEDDHSDDTSKLTPGKRDDPIIYLTGGPGAKATYYLKRFKDHGIRKHRDMYILEQRGIGYSDDFCPFYSLRKPEVSNVSTFEKHLASQITGMLDCSNRAASHGVDLSGYNTIENARDVKALRIALGHTQWNVWGISYGTILGQAYLKVDPEGIRAIVLDSIVPLDVQNNSWAWRTVQWYDQDLKKLDALCKAQTDCAKHYPNLGERIREATLSVKGKPISVEVLDKERYPGGKAYFFTDVVAFLPFMLFYEQDNYPALPGLIHAWSEAVERRDQTIFRAIALAAAMDFGMMSPGMHNTIFCLDGDAAAQAVAAQADLQAFPVLGAAIYTPESIKQRADVCNGSLAPRDAAEYAGVTTQIPAMLIAGGMDPITPAQLAKAILPGFTRGTYVEFPFAGHGPSRSVDCAGDMLNAFFDQPNDKPDLSCVDKLKKPVFYAPIFRSSFVPSMLVKALEDKKNLAGPGVWAGISILVSIIGFLVLSIAPFGRKIEKRDAVPAGWSRVATWTAAFFAVVAPAVMAGALGVTYEQSEMLLLFGLVPWARFAAIAGLVSGIIGLAAIVLTIRAHYLRKLPMGTLLGFLMTGGCAVSLCIFMMSWDLGPF